MPSVQTCRLGASLAAEHSEEPRTWGFVSQDGFSSDGVGMLLSRITERPISLPASMLAPSPRALYQPVSLPRWVSSESPSLVHLYFPRYWRLQALTLMSFVSVEKEVKQKMGENTIQYKQRQQYFSVRASVQTQVVPLLEPVVLEELVPSRDLERA